jgi:predicted N-formylglutamate amidohydrolase
VIANSESLLAPDEPPPVEVVNARGAGSAVVVCDHAANRVPRRLAGLGLYSAQLATHIAWDPGAGQVAQRLAQHLDAPLVLSGYSRLVIDCNRPLTHDESIAPTSAGVAVPGNQAVSAADRALRAATLFHPYHRAISEVLDQRRAACRPSLLLSIHSFTPVLNGSPRPWHVGFSHGRDARLADSLIGTFGPDNRCVVGHNQPYDVDDAIDYTIPRHGEQRGLAHVLIEIRQDLLTTAAECAGWAERLAVAYRRSEPSLLS